MLKVENIEIIFNTELGQTVAVKDFSFHVKKGEIMAVVGESGSGKSVCALSITALLKEQGAVLTKGKIIFNNQIIDYNDEKKLREIRGGEIAYIFQEPMVSLNPLHTIGRQITERLIYVEGVSKTEAMEANIKKLEAEVEQAKLNLQYTKVYAPQAGKVSARSVEMGNYLQVGQPIMQIVPDEVWVVANFKEIQLTHMKEGQPVSIKIDTYPHKRFKGEVQSIQRATGAKSSLFPPENAVGSYVKIVQRVPVKIVFKEDISNYNIVPGMSVVPKVKVK